MAIAFRCDCGTVLKAKDTATGKSITCPQCGTQSTVPSPRDVTTRGERKPDNRKTQPQEAPRKKRSVKEEPGWYKKPVILIGAGVAAACIIIVVVAGTLLMGPQRATGADSAASTRSEASHFACSQSPETGVPRCRSRPCYSRLASGLGKRRSRARLDEPRAESVGFSSRSGSRNAWRSVRISPSSVSARNGIEVADAKRTIRN